LSPSREQAAARSSFTVAALASLLGLLSGCNVFTAQPPCETDENCLSDQRCDLDTGACVPRVEPEQDAARPPVDAGPLDIELADQSAVDQAQLDVARIDAAVPDVAASDAASPDTLLPDATQDDVVSGCIDGDGDGFGPGCALGPDCDDGNQNVYEGTSCNDGSGQTQYDVCQGGVCRGLHTDSGGCGGGCSGCAPDSCCQETCSSPACTDCGAGCSCYFEFDNSGQDVALSCATGSSCYLFVNNGSDVTTTCDGAVCYQECNSSDGICDIDCRNGAACALYCNGGQSSCEILGCPGGAQGCGDGKTYVCNRPCP